jgi:hypothetical protein
MVLAPMALPIAIAALLLLLALLIASPAWFVLAYLFFAPFSTPTIQVGSELKDVGFGFALTPFLGMLFLMTVSPVVYMLAKRQRPTVPRLIAADVAAIAVLLTTLLSTSVAISPIRAIRLDLSLGLNLVAYAALRVLASDRKWLVPITATAIASSVVVSLIGLAQYADYTFRGEQLPIWPLSYIPYVGARLQGTLSGSNYFGSYAVGAFPLLLAATRVDSLKRWRSLVWVAIATLSIATFLSYSRYNLLVYAMIFAVFTLLALRRLTWWLGLATIGLISAAAWQSTGLLLQERAIVAIVDPLNDINLNTRFDQYRRGFDLLGQFPILGIGPGQPTLFLPLSYGQPDVIHNDILNRFVETGVLGGASYLAFLAFITWGGFRVAAQLRADPTLGPLGLGWALTMPFAFLGAQLYPHFYEPTNWVLFGVVAGLGASTTIPRATSAPADSTARRQDRPAPA